MAQMRNKPQGRLVNTSSATRRVIRNFIRGGGNNNRVSIPKYFYCRIFL